MIGSVVGEPHNPYLKCSTCLKDEPEIDMDWGITFSDPFSHNRKNSKSVMLRTSKASLRGQKLRQVSKFECRKSLGKDAPMLRR
mmetsp:Transcript_2650/g.3741  ORF Transcript_2650/g.3741 Transcript_2650/m.3741 type:complete len:84 (-) Transcript_2650:467-718(-)